MVQLYGIAGLAQQAERIHGKDEVAGSIPATSISFNPALAGFFLFQKYLDMKVFCDKIDNGNRNEHWLTPLYLNENEHGL